ncbi:MAG: hypothetical protein QXZ66_07320 [Thermoproteota archaeon]
MINVKIPLTMKSQLFEITLGFLILFGCFVFLQGPIIYNRSLNETSDMSVRLEPKENHTINFPLSTDQAFYIVSGRNLIVDDRIKILINSTSNLTLFRVSWSGNDKMVSNITNYCAITSYFDLKDTRSLLLVNFNPDPAYAQVYIMHKMVVMMADYTYVFIGFTVFCFSLFLLQLIIILKQRKTVVEAIVLTLFRKFLKSEGEINHLIMHGCMILEVYGPILFFGMGVYALTIMPGKLLVETFFSSYNGLFF